MSDAIDAKPFPRGALVAGAMLIGTSLAFAAVARLTDVGATRLNLAPVTASRDLVFTDAENGAVEVVDAGTHRQVVSLAPGESGFVRVVLRGLARDRLTRQVASAEPFRLQRHDNGIATLEDLATGKVVTLTAFGADNAAAFTQLLN